MGYATERNEFGQPTDSKGHVLKTREIMAEELEAMLGVSHIPGQTTTEIDKLTEYIMEHDYKDWYDGYRQGLEQGRKEGQAIKAAKETKR
jgi:hypothetical protein